MRRLFAVLTSLLLLGTGVWVGGRHPELLPNRVADVLVGTSDQRAAREAMDDVHDDYYRKIPHAAITDAALGGLVRSLHDRFSNYFDAKEYRSFQDETSGRFSGVGLAVRKAPKGLRIMTVYDQSPAKRAGLKVGDVIVTAGGHSLAGLSEDAATARIKGPAGTEVTLRVRRGKRTLTVHVTRATVSVPVVASSPARAAGRRVTHIRLAMFSSGAGDEVAAAIARARRHGAKGIVFDLRGNGGGLVDEARNVASAFLTKGQVVVTTRGRAVTDRTLKAAGHPVAGTLPTVVLVDRDTASAAEIVTGALQDNHRATVVGTRTFGKGVFQEVINLRNGGALDITVGQYFTPNGRNLGGQGTKTGAGIHPDVEARDNPRTKRDEGLQKALEVLARKL